MTNKSISGAFLEFQVYTLLKDSCTSSEIIESDKLFRIDENGQFFIADFYLRQGCNHLAIPPKTAMEVKDHLLFDTIDRYVRVFDALNTNGIESLYLVVSDGVEVNHDTLPHGFKIVSFEYLANRALSCDKIEEPGIEEVTEQRIKRAQVVAASGKSTFFLGSGVSISAGLPSWDKLLERLLDILKNRNHTILEYDKLIHDSWNSSIIFARYIENCFSDAETFKEAIRTALYREVPKSSGIIEAISQIILRRNRIVQNKDGATINQLGKRIGEIDSVITYNYDDCLETQLDNDGVNYNSITKGNRVDPGAFPIYHVHGFIPNNGARGISDVVLTESAYHNIYGESYHWSNIEQLHALGNTTCFFVGLSMSDPNLRRLIDQAADRDRNEAFHYAILYKDNFEDQILADRLFIKLGVNALWVKSFDDIPALLNQVFLETTQLL